MSPPRARSALAGLLLVLTVVGLVTGCSQSDRPQRTPAQVLATAKEKLDATSGVHLDLAAAHLPAGTNALVSATGVGTHEPAFKGSIKVAASGITADAPVVAVDGEVYAQLPFQTAFVTIDPADYSAPDPAALLSPRGGLSALLTSTTGVEEGKQTRIGDQVLRSYRGTVPGRDVAAVLPSAATGSSFDATYRVDGDGRLSQAVLTGPFYPQAPAVTYTIDFTGYGSHPRIKAPPTTGR